MKFFSLIANIHKGICDKPNTISRRYEFLPPLEKKIFNNGERLIPGVTHDLAELIRHKSSYEFVRMVIEGDLPIIEKNIPSSNPIKIIDLGCGVGHGCQTLSKIQNSDITGIDFSQECLEYAGSHYPGTNIRYQLADLTEFIPVMPEYDYVVSRGVFEHIPNGMQIAMSTKWRCRLLFDVPYDELGGPNPHHAITGIREEDFLEFPEVELFFQDLSGITYDIQNKPVKPNMIMCVRSHPDLPKVGSMNIDFPLPAWQSETELY